MSCFVAMSSLVTEDSILFIWVQHTWFAGTGATLREVCLYEPVEEVEEVGGLFARSRCLEDRSE
jgi:hypothetical protein